MLTYEQADKIWDYLAKYQQYLYNNEIENADDIFEISVLILALENMHRKSEGKQGQKETTMENAYNLPTAEEAAGIVEENMKPIRKEWLNTLMQEVDKRIRASRNSVISIILSDGWVDVVDEAIAILNNLGYGAKITNPDSREIGPKSYLVITWQETK